MFMIYAVRVNAVFLLMTEQHIFHFDLLLSALLFSVMSFTAFVTLF